MLPLENSSPRTFHMRDPSNEDSSSKASSVSVSEPTWEDGCGLLDLADANANHEIPDLETLNAHLATLQAKLINSSHLER